LSGTGPLRAAPVASLDTDGPHHDAGARPPGILPPDTSVAVLSLPGDVMTNSSDTAEFLDVEMDDLPGSCRS
jgi:hypothetical protein